jgi:hypothetical protein
MVMEKVTPATVIIEPATVDSSARALRRDRREPAELVNPGRAERLVRHGRRDAGKHRRQRHYRRREPEAGSQRVPVFRQRRVHPFPSAERGRLEAVSPIR